MRKRKNNPLQIDTKFDESYFKSSHVGNDLDQLRGASGRFISLRE